jgi:hypothetical protein
MWWEPRDDRGDDGFYLAQLPEPDEVADLLAKRPQLLGAYLADRDALPYAGLWHAEPLARPTMSVAGVAITASMDDDGVLAVDIDPTRTPAKVMHPAGPGTPVRVRLAATVAHPPAPATTGEDDGDEYDIDDECEGAEDRTVCRTEDCDEDPRGGEGWEGFCGNCADRIYAQEHPEDDEQYAESETGVDAADDADAELKQILNAPSLTVPINFVGQLETWFAGNEQMRYSTTPRDSRYYNHQRAGFAAAAVLAYARHCGYLAENEILDVVISDLLTDLRHLCHTQNTDWGDTDLYGARRYGDELALEC